MVTTRVAVVLTQVWRVIQLPVFNPTGYIRVDTQSESLTIIYSVVDIQLSSECKLDEVITDGSEGNHIVNHLFNCV